MKKFVSILLAVMMIIAMLPASVFAAETATATLSFANKAQRTAFSTTSQTWEQNGVKFVNNKAKSNNTVGDYASPVRLYASSEIIVEFAEPMTKIEFTCNGSYASALQKSISGSTVNGKVVTVELAGVTSFTVEKLSAQVRLDSLTVTYEVGGGDQGGSDKCNHENTVDVAETPATCTAAGRTAGVQCEDCEEFLSGHEIIPATGHSMSDWDTIVDATCSEAGEQTRGCANCDLVETQAIAALGHDFDEDGVCGACGYEAVLTQYELITSADDLADGDQIILVGVNKSGAYYAMLPYTSGNNLKAEAIDAPVDGVITLPDTSAAAIVTLGDTDAGWTLFDGAKYLNSPGKAANNYMKGVATLPTDNTGAWTIEIDEDGIATIVNVGNNVSGARNVVKFNYGNNPVLFANYKIDYTTNVALVSIYRLVVEEEVEVNTHDLTYYPAVEASCHQDGYAEYWYCAECDIYFADAAATQLTNIKNLVVEAAAPLTYVAAQDATCHQRGHAEYWYCAECEAIFADAAGMQLTNIKNISTPALLGLTHVDAVEASCHQAGHAEYWYCMECEAVFADAAGTMLTNIKNLSTPALVGLTHVAAQEATCHQNGHAEYWYCTECEAVFADAAGMMLTNIKNLTIEAAPLTYVAAQEASCHQAGHAEYWYCMECEAIFTDAAGIHLTNIKNISTPALVGLTHVDAREATCHQTGHAEYWYCMECEAVFADAAGTMLTNIKNISTPALVGLTYVPAAEASCHQNGHAEYWYCAECEAVFADAAGMMLTNIKNLTIEAAPLVYVAAQEATCHQDGHAEYWYCAECDAVFADAAGIMLTNRKNLTIEAAPLTYVPALEASCHQAGHAEYWYCMECEAIFTDAAGIHLTNIKNLSTPALVGLTHVEAQEATCHQRGHAEYWYCAECEAVFADAAGTMLTNIKNISTPALVGLTHVEAQEATCHQRGHAEYWYCTECEAVFADAAGMMLTNIKNLTIEAAPLTYVAAVAADFGKAGHYEYWYCAECEAIFTDAAGIHLTNIKNLTIPALVAVAQIGEQKFASLADAIAAAGTEAVEIDLITDITLDAGLVINKGQNITLDLNGYTVTYTSNLPGDDMIVNRGNLTITDSAEGGKLTYVNTDTTAYNVTVSTISTEAGSVLVINGGIIENKTVYTNGIYAYAIDALTNGNLGDVYVTINDGTVYSDYAAIRQFNNGTACINSLTVNGGYIYAAGRAIQSHIANNAAHTTITGGKFEAGQYVLCLFATEAPISITGGEFIGMIYSATADIISGGTYNDSELLKYADYYCAAGFTVKDNGDGTYGIAEEEILNPEDQETVAGEYVTFTAEGIGEGLTYQWQYSPNGGKGWFNSSSATQGYNTNTLTVKAELVRDGYLYRCRITDAEGNKVYTEAAVLNVLPGDTTIVTNPADATVDVGTTANFSVVVEGEGLTYKWEYSVNGGKGWRSSTFAGCDTASMDVVATEARNGFLYRCRITDAKGNTYISEAATLTVKVIAVTDPEDQVVAAGTVVTFTASVEAEVVSYKWEYSVNGGKGWFSSTFAGCDTASMDVVATEARDGFMYRCRIVTADGEVIVTEPATLTVQ